MQRTKLRFLFTPLWILNIYIQFGFLYNVLPKSDGKLSLRWLSITSLLLLFSLLLTRDIFIFRRVIFLKIIGFALLFFSCIYSFVIFLNMNISSIVYLFIMIPTLLTAIFIIKRVK